MTLLSILICSVIERENQFHNLLSALDAQKSYLDDGGEVEILYIIDNKEISVGAKRNKLLEMAKGEYVAFIDDDDMVTGDYLKSILEILDYNRPDCIGIRAIITFEGIAPEIREFYYSNKGNFRGPDGIMHSPPYHLNPIRATIAKSVKFPDKNLQEDVAWAEAIRPKIKSGIDIDQPIYLYKFSATNSLTQRNEYTHLAVKTLQRVRRRRLWDASGKLVLHPDEKRR